jgi:hypothetical protein
VQSRAIWMHGVRNARDEDYASDGSILFIIQS